jgi:predicted RNA-binding Zn-ribbon protein involved in translation (DUF1610 family)
MANKIFNSSIGNTNLVVTCMKCGYNIRSHKSIFFGKETSYVCPSCEYEGYAYNSNTEAEKC